ncbi:MAG TPA: HIT family protein, partial [Ktedonobacterales bacterium]
GDFSLEEYLALQQFIFWIAEALRQTGPTERIYLLSLGSQQGNRHVHWHVVPLPPGVPYEEQQMEALRPGRGVLELSDEEMTALAKTIRQALELLGVF